MAFICPEPGCNREFPSKMSLAQHKKWHNPKFRERFTGENNYLFGKIGKENPVYGIDRSGEKATNYGKFGEDHPKYKENASDSANHMWIRKHYPPEEICDNKCEICNKFRLDLELAQFRHINVRNMEDPMIDYLYICPYTEKNSCHYIYDKLSDKQKEKLLAGATTREEKLERVREFVMKIKKGERNQK